MANKNDLRIKIAIDSDTKELVLTRNEVNKLNTSFNSASTSSTKMITAMKAIGGTYVVFEALNRTIGEVARTGFAYNNSIEQSRAGLVALSVAVQDKTIPVMERYSRANTEAGNTLQKLQGINAQTPHTLDQTNQIYKAMYVSMNNAGASTADMIEMTRSLSIASGAAGIEFNSLLAGVDGLATGTVLANSDLGRFISGLGLTNKALQETDDVVGLITTTLQDFKAADTMAVSVSNLENSWNQLAGSLTKDIFEDSKGYLNSFAETLDEARGAVDRWKIDLMSVDEVVATGNLSDLRIKLSEINEDLFIAQEKQGKSYLNQKNLAQEVANRKWDILKIEEAIADALKRQANELEVSKSVSSTPSTNVGKEAVKHKIDDTPFEEIVIDLNATLNVDTKELDKVLDSVGSQDWTSGLTGQAKSIANIGNAFADIGKYQKAFEKESKGVVLNEEQKSKHLGNQLGQYGNIAGAMGNMFEEGSKGAQAAQAAQAALAVVEGGLAIVHAMTAGDPYTAVARAIAVAAVVQQAIGGSGGGSAPSMSASEIGFETSKMENETVTNQLDQQIALLEAIEKNGSAAALNVDLAKAEFESNKLAWVQDTFSDARMGYVNAMFTEDSEHWKNIQNYYADKDLVNPYLMSRDEISINAEHFRSNPDDLIKVMADMSTMTRGEGFSYTGPFGQDLAAEMGWSDEAHEAFLASIKLGFSELQGYLNDWAISTVEQFTDLSDASESLGEAYDNLTGTSKYKDIELDNAYEDFNRLIANTGQTYAQYIEANIANIEGTKNFMDRLSGVSLNIDGKEKELTNLELMYSKEGDLIDEQMAKQEEFTRELGIVFDSGAKDMLDSLDSIELVVEAISDVSVTAQEAANNIFDAWNGNLSYLNIQQKSALADGYYQMSLEDNSSISSVDAALKQAELAMQTARTKEEYIPAFDRYIQELQNEAPENTLDNVVDRLDTLITEVRDLEETQRRVA